MLNIHTLTLGAYGTNCYIVHDSASETCCVIDPGYTPEKVLSEVNALGLTVEAILLTHGHFDHVGGVKEIAAETGLTLPTVKSHVQAAYRKLDVHAAPDAVLRARELGLL